MIKKDLMKYEEKLLERKMQLLKQRGFTGAMLLRPEQQASDGAVRTPSDIAEQGYDTYQCELASRMTSDQTKSLIEIDEALRRIERKTYGICESCGKKIPRARLDVVPYARYDLKCLKQKELEQFKIPEKPERRLRRRRKRR